MANPNPYTPSYSFSGWQTSNPAKPLPAPQVDNELANISTSLNAAISGLLDIRRSDGKLKNGIVTFESLNNDLKAGYSGGAVSAWAPVVDYAAGIVATSIAPATVVVYQGESYVCTTDHVTTALFDVTKWHKIAARGANGTGSGDMLASLNLSDLTNKPQARINLGLGNVDNTNDAGKPISTATQAAFDTVNASLAALTAAQFDFFTDCVPSYVSVTSISFSSGVGLFGNKKHILPAYTKLMSATFAAGAGVGMLDTGTIGASKTYFLFAIRNTSTGDCDYLASLSLTPLVPAGWELNSGSRIGIILTNGSSQIRNFVQTGNQVTIIGTAQQVFTTSTSIAAALIALPNCPVGISVGAMLALDVSASTNGDVSAYLSDYSAPDAQRVRARTFCAAQPSATVAQANYAPVRTNTLAQVYRSVGVVTGPATATGYINGWVDHQCKRLFP
ncbi:hypothetical protein Rleg2_4156 [Rhizobium leguminosarum bv. trifolii WSM2304]|uniref:Uncharacterized protein n=1 Tax=Rhizobium leguminosarum bv. trifolii (strain WSM2304) TaxID=395492 RepID=A0ABF7QST9_RHILW|nr:hypothetical protein [Rhizobium leguminosarum]ACI57418.1 hypothetical protein Rleg2_4156 [Rhizobium leguminosarum bv. trifolii WSM2304]